LPAAADLTPPPLFDASHEALAPDMPFRDALSSTVESLHEPELRSHHPGLGVDDIHSMPPGKPRHQLSVDDFTDEVVRDIPPLPPEPEFNVDDVLTTETDVPTRPAPFESVQAGGRSSSGVWPLMLALVVGIALGFGMAMLLLGRDRVPMAPTQAATSPGTGRPATEVRDEPIREVTEQTVAAPPKPAAPPSAATAPAEPPRPFRTPLRLLLLRKHPLRRHPHPPTRNRTPRNRPRPRHQGLQLGETTIARQHAVATCSSQAAGGCDEVAANQAWTATRATPAPGRGAANRAATPPAKAAAPTAAKPESGSLVVESRPSGASVYLDGRRVGTTPLTLDTIKAGQYTIGLDIDGYKRWATSVRVTSGERSRVAASLER
jgi:hypothetical protein